jgi:hypothetical protein
MTCVTGVTGVTGRVGVAIVVTAGLYMFHRERVRKRISQ